MRMSLLSRRNVLKVAGAGAGAAVLAALLPPVSAQAAVYTHPGLLHTEADFTRMATQVGAGLQPWKAGYDRLAANAHSQASWKPNPQTSITRGAGWPNNYQAAYNDIAAAYQNALAWKVTGNSANARTAVAILNGWASSLTVIQGSADRFLAAGLYGYQFANAAEIMRGYPGFNLAAFQYMMRKVFYPVNNEFLLHHNGACITNYWANWDLCTMNSILAIGVLCDDSSMVNQAIDYFYNGAGNGSIKHLIPYVYADGTAQCQESGRDQGHTMLDVALIGSFCQMAWNQGIDLYGYDNNRVLKMCEYVAKYNLGNDVQYTPYSWQSGSTCGGWSTQSVVSPWARGNVRPAWALIYSHYVQLKGLPAPYVTAYKDMVGTEGGGGDYGSTSGGFDQLGFGTLAYTLQANSENVPTESASPVATPSVPAAAPVTPTGSPSSAAPVTPAAQVTTPTLSSSSAAPITSDVSPPSAVTPSATSSGVPQAVGAQAGELAYTGFESAPLIGAGALLAVSGGAAVLFGSWRKRQH